MELRELRAFIAVVEERGMSAAARRLHVSQSALSQTVSSLERQMGLKLLIRTNTGVRPTEEGEALLTEARALIARHDQALRTMAGFTSPGCGLLRVGIPLELPSDLLRPAMEQVAAACPETRVQARHLPSAAQLDALHAGELDIGLLRERPADPDLDAMLVVSEKLGVLLAASVAAELADEDGVRLETLRGLEWVGFPRSGSPAWYDEVTSVLRSFGLDPGPEPPQDQALIAEVKLAAVTTKKAFALAPPNWSQALPDNVVWKPLHKHPLMRRTWAAWPTHSRRRDLASFIAGLPTPDD
ncbi:LysR family transcriptional regulator [Streptomyces chiangmaiensis]|uniref:LysR family transcriptional regulator n=1 Tax=Streptomyces chiangmaiensis TaxID=766497 RepID=A0ABU7FSK2_9ACTN|nr:LysR family transcriptional regulator [Streptomyces chiangmaiensis]MED7826762.1 LysR family transcriptional regulator [Streptomyces chiangmaiensis]